MRMYCFIKMLIAFILNFGIDLQSLFYCSINVCLAFWEPFSDSPSDGMQRGSIRCGINVNEYRRNSEMPVLSDCLLN